MSKKRSNSSSSTLSQDEKVTVLLDSNPCKEPRNDIYIMSTTTTTTDSSPIIEMGEFEDAFEDEMEHEDVVYEDAESDDDDMDIMEGEEQEQVEAVVAYLPGQELKEGEVLDFDPSAYKMFHSLNVEWPCLSFDILRDHLGDNRTNYPATSYLVSGTQADKWANNKLLILKMSKLHKMKRVVMDNDESEDDTDNEDDIDEDPILEHVDIKHYGGVNRVRVMPHDNVHVVSTWAETGKVHIWDISENVKALDTPGTMMNRKLTPIHTIQQHSSEGFAMDWSKRVSGRLVTGDCSNNIFLTERNESTGWITDPQSFRGHDGSVEDLQWSPSENSVFASCSTDKTIKIWDTRMKKQCGMSVYAHECDVNVISWNRIVPYLMASGGDDGQFRIWDLRNFKSNDPSASFGWHKKAITSIEWHPTDEAMLVSTGEDDQITIWDFAVEKDTEEMQVGNEAQIGDIPPQLMFIHQGQEHVKEAHWHGQLPDTILSTALSGFNIFKTNN